MTGWQGLVKVYEKALDGSNQCIQDGKERAWSLDDVANAYSKILAICSQNADIERYNNTSTKLAEFYHLKLNDLNQALGVLTEKVSFMENQGDSGKIRETYAVIIRLLCSESQTNDLNECHTTLLCTALEKVFE